MKKSLLSVLLLSYMPYVAAQQAFPTVDCVISPSQITNVSAAAPGVVERVWVQPGDSVVQGQLLAELAAGVEKASVKLAQARADMKADLSAEQVNLRYDRMQEKRVEALASQKMVSSQNKDEAARIRDLSYWRLAQAKEDKQLRVLELERAKAQLEQKRIYAPMPGVVAEQFKYPGEYVEDQPVMRLVALDRLEVNAVFPLSLFPKVQKGMQGQVFPETDQTQGYPVVVTRIDPVGDAASGTFRAQLLLNNRDAQLPAGLKCFLQLDPERPLAQAEPSEPVAIPREAAANPDRVSQADTPIASNASESPEQAAPSEPAPVVLAEPPVKAQASLPAVVETPPAGARTLGPFTSQKALAHVKAVLNRESVSYEIRESETAEVVGYLVLAAADYSAAPKALMALFRQKGVRDMMQLPKRSYNGRISFGAYNGPLQAQTRQADLAKRDIRAEVVERKVARSAYWIDVPVLPTHIEAQL